MSTETPPVRREPHRPATVVASAAGRSPADPAGVFRAWPAIRRRHVNEAHYLSRLKHSWDPSWCAGDFCSSNSPDAHGLFVWAFGWITQLLSLAATAWVGRTLAWTLLAWAWQRLSWRLVPVPLTSVLAAALWVTLIEWIAFRRRMGGRRLRSQVLRLCLRAGRFRSDGRSPLEPRLDRCSARPARFTCWWVAGR